MSPHADSFPRGDLEWGTLARMYRSSAERFGDAEALVDGDVRWSFRVLFAESQQAARGLLALGIERGDRVAIWAPNVAEWVVAAMAVHATGAVLVPVNTRFKAPEAGFVLAGSRARVLVVIGRFLGVDYLGALREALGGPDGDRPVAGLPDLEHVVVVRPDVPADATLAWRTFLDGGARVDAAEADRRALTVDGDDLSDILFTSGTTGAPKGVMTTHAQTLRAYRAWSELAGLREGDRYLIVNPFFHGFGYKGGWVIALMMGATILPCAVFDVDDVLATVEAERVTVLPGPPTLYQSILDHPRRHDHDLSSLRLAVTGAAVVPVELIRRMRDELTFRTVLTGYGLTEATAVVSVCRPDDSPETVATTCGRPLPGVEVRVVDDAGVEVPTGEPGELLVRGYNVMKGYLDEPEATAAAIDSDGWLRTGDVAVVDGRGYLAITDRKKDMYIVGGFNAYPAEIENVLLAHESIAQVAVVGMPDERMGEVGVAFVVPREGTTARPDEIIAWSRERMANFKAPRRVEIVDALPLNATGKVLKYELRERAQALVQPALTTTHEGTTR